MKHEKTDTGMKSAQEQLRELAFYASREHPCSYLPDRQATSLFADPNQPMNMALYGLLLEYGFRRSGRHVYRPCCTDCKACLSLRVPVDAIELQRIDRRIIQRNADIEITPVEQCFNQEHFALYRDYIASRHGGGGMDNAQPQEYLTFLTSPWSDTAFYEFRLSGRLVAVAVTDRSYNALSAVYTFYDPHESARSLGHFAVLSQIAEAKRQGLDWLYLGYWIEDCAKMRYKTRYRPHEVYRNGMWMMEV